MKNMNASENSRYRQAAEYATTIEVARNVAGVVTPADCLAYELRQYMAAYSSQVYSREKVNEEGPELLSTEHPDYPKRLADRSNEGKQQLNKIYELHEQELASEWVADRSNNPPDERLLLSRLLQEAARRLLDGYSDYLTRVGEGRLLPGSVGWIGRIGGNIHPVETFASRLGRMRERTEKGSVTYGLSYSAGRYAELDRTLVAAGAGAAELAHFQRLLAEFHQAEQVLTLKIQPGIENIDACAVANSYWDGLLTNYTLTDLNKLLVFVGLLETSEPLTVADETKAGQWVAIADALRKTKRTTADRAALYRAFSKTYGPAVGSLSSFQRPYNEANPMANACYTRALIRLGQS